MEAEWGRLSGDKLLLKKVSKYMQNNFTDKRRGEELQ